MNEKKIYSDNQVEPDGPFLLASSFFFLVVDGFVFLFFSFLFVRRLLWTVMTGV